MPITNEAVYRRLEGIKNETTRKTYETRLKTLSLLLGEDVYGICKRPERYVPMLKRTYRSQCTQRNMASAVLTVFNMFPDLKSKKPRAYDGWVSFQRSIREAYAPQEQSYKNEIEEAYRSRRGGLQRGPKESSRVLLLSLATHAPWAVKHGATMAAVFPPTTKSPSENYVYMCPKNPLLVAGNRRAAFGEELFADISASLRANPRQFLFVGSDGNPFRKQNSYGVFVKRAMQDATGRAIGVNDIGRRPVPAKAPP